MGLACREASRNYSQCSAESNYDRECRMIDATHCFPVRLKAKGEACSAVTQKKCSDCSGGWSLAIKYLCCLNCNCHWEWRQRLQLGLSWR